VYATWESNQYYTKSPHCPRYTPTHTAIDCMSLENKSILHKVASLSSLHTYQSCWRVIFLESRVTVAESESSHESPQKISHESRVESRVMAAESRVKSRVIKTWLESWLESSHESTALELRSLPVTRLHDCSPVGVASLVDQGASCMLAVYLSNELASNY